MSKTESNNANTSEQAIADREHFLYTERLLTDKKERVKDYRPVQQLFREVLALEDTKWLSEYIDLLLKADVRVVEGFFAKEWADLPDPKRQTVLKKLTSLPGERGAIRQVSAAHKIATVDAESASHIIYQLAGANKQRDHSLVPTLSKEKRDALRTRFLSSPENWRDLHSEDPQVFRVVVFTFCTLVDEMDDFGKPGSVGPALKFSKWLMQAVSRMELSDDDAVRSEVILQKVTRRLPPNVQEELRKLSPRIVAPGATAEAGSPRQSMLNEVHESAVSTDFTNQVEPAADSREAFGKADIEREAKASERLNNNKKPADKTRETVLGTMSAEQLLQNKQRAIAEAEKEMQAISRLITESNALKERVATLQRSLDVAHEEVDKSRSELISLRSLNQEAEKSLAKSTSELQRVQEYVSELQKDLAQTKSSLDEKSAQVQAERDEFAKSSTDRITFELDNFKGSLREKLRPIFENKRQTDDLDDDAELSRFLRKWFEQVEDVLAKNGVNP